MIPAEEGFADAVARLDNRVAHWTPARWAAGPGGELVHGLVQHLADLAADAEQQPRRPVPRLEHDTALPDQLKVVAADLRAARPADPVLTAATDAVRNTGAAL